MTAVPRQLPQQSEMPEMEVDAPRIPEGWELLEHKILCAPWDWARVNFIRADQILLFNNKLPGNPENLEGNLIYDLFSQAEVLGADILDQLLDHQDYMPSHWKDLSVGNDPQRPIFLLFLGTLYECLDRGDKERVVRGMYYDVIAEKWMSTYCLLYSQWDRRCLIVHWVSSD